MARTLLARLKEAMVRLRRSQNLKVVFAMRVTRLPRLTTWRWILVIATLTVLFAGLILKRRSDYFWARAIYWEDREKYCAALAIDYERLAKDLEEKPDRIADLVFSLGMNTNRGSSDRAAFDAARMRVYEQQYGTLKREFYRAARRPWKSAPPEPLPEQAEP
jgi:hypothetical protein